MASEETQWQSEPTKAGFCWARDLEDKDVIVEIIDNRPKSDTDQGWLIKRHGRSAAKPLEELPRKVRFTPVLSPPA